MSTELEIVTRVLLDRFVYEDNQEFAREAVTAHAAAVLAALGDAGALGVDGGQAVANAGALDVIAEWLRDPEWGVGMLEDIAEAVVATGRDIQNYPDERPTWGRH